MGIYLSKPNIVLVVFDTLRWDFFQRFLSGDYVFSETLKDFVSCETAFAPTSWTLPSHFSLFTGLYPSEHGIHESPDSEMDDIYRRSVKWKGNFLTQTASELGYQTIGISANPMISGLTGFDKRFDIFYNVDMGVLFNFNRGYRQGSIRHETTKKSHRDFSFFKSLSPFYALMKREKSHIVSVLRGYPKNKGHTMAFSFLQKTPISRPFFVFFNLMEMHDPYSQIFFQDNNFLILRDLFAIHTLSRRRLKSYQMAYFRNIEQIKIFITNLIDYLKRKGLYGNSLIIFTSDHGQAFKEHNYYGHGVYLWDELIHIPLLIKFPDNYVLDRNDLNYVNLVDLYHLMKAVMEDNTELARFLNHDQTFAESFGMQYSKSSLRKYVRSTSKAYDIFKEANIPRKSIIKNGIKLTINGRSEVEEYSSLTKAKIHDLDFHAVNDLLFELEIFSGNTGFNIDKSIIADGFFGSNE